MRYLIAPCLLAVAAAAIGGCQPVNNLYKKNTGELAPVPGPPSPQPMYVDPATRPAPGSDLDAVDETGAADIQATPEAMPPAAGETIQPLPEPQPAPPRTYTIKRGDSYWKIAKEIYGDGMRMTDIQKANPDVDPAKLQVGDEIILPN